MELTSIQDRSSGTGVLARTWLHMSRGDWCGHVSYHLMKTQVDFVRRKFGSCPNTPLFPTSSGAHFTKIDFVRLVELAASHLGHPLEADNRHLFGGHSARVSGAQWLVRRGMEIWRVQVLGRWGSSAVLACIRDVPVSSSSCFAPQLSQRLSLEDVVTKIPKLAHRISSAEGVADSAANVARESGLKEVDVRSIIESEMRTIRASWDDTFRTLREPECVRKLDSGKVHRISFGELKSPPNKWRASCGWPFGCGNSVRISTRPSDRASLCASCYPEIGRGRLNYDR